MWDQLNWIACVVNGTIHALSKWPHIRAMHAFGSWELIGNCLVSVISFLQKNKQMIWCNEWRIVKILRLWWGKMKYGLKYTEWFYICKVVGSGEWRGKIHVGRGEFDENILKLMSIKSQIPCFATGKGYRVKLPRKNVVQNGMSNQQPYP